MTVKVKFRHESENEDVLNEEGEVIKTIRHYWGTTCRIEDDGVELARSTALLSPKDQFSRPFGRSLAYWRAIDSLKENLYVGNEKLRSIRKQAYLWLESHNTTILPKEKVGLA